jgi:hypothetical protein
MHQARFGEKAQHTSEYVSILSRADELLNIHKNKCEIPLLRGNTAMGTQTHF